MFVGIGCGGARLERPHDPLVQGLKRVAIFRLKSGTWGYRHDLHGIPSPGSKLFPMAMYFWFFRVPWSLLG
jgi:hypothetical protein